MTIFYLSGPMRSKPFHNAAEFADVESALIAWLYDGVQNIDDRVVNPSRNFSGDQTLDPSEYMTLDLAQVLACDVIVLLPGWEQSEGARRETQLGMWTSKTFMLAGTGSGKWDFSHVDPAHLNEPTSVRAQTLAKATGYITGDRNNAYGPPHADFRRSADAMTAYGYRHTQLAASDPPCRACGARPLVSHDTAIAVDCVKTSRLMWNPTKEDSWIDKAGYAACGYECALADQAERMDAA